MTNDSLSSYYFGGAYEVTDGSVKKYYSFGGQSILRDSDGLKYMLTDHLGPTLAVTNESGAVLSQQRYLPFGGVRAVTGSPFVTETDLGYTGQRSMSGMGLMDYRARFYSVSLMRFTQPDTLIPGTSSPQNFNRYSYVTDF